MNISMLTSRDAVLDAMAEFDLLGRDEFLARYRYGAAKQHFVVHDGKNYDSKAIAGVAFGKQFPEQGPLQSEEFSGGEKTVKAKLQSLGFAFVDETTITSIDMALLRQSKLKTKYSDLTDDERGAYIRITGALKDLGTTIVRLLDDTQYDLKLTSGFHLGSGVRGSIPKDLWFGIFAKENATAFAGSPQLFMIVSDRGIEFGFGASTHPSGFSNSEIKAAVRAAAPKIFQQLPEPGTPNATALFDALTRSGGWHFRKQTRLTPDQDDFPNLQSWLEFLRSPQGQANAGGSISRYVLEADVDNQDLATQLIEMVQIFQPIMEFVRPNNARSLPNMETAEGSGQHRGSTVGSS